MTAVVSAFLDNVTTVVLMTPVILSVARRLGMSPMPYLISSILASNIGGTATLIGDPPNILIGSASGLGFDDFLFNLGPVIVVVFLAFAVIMRFSFRGMLQVPDERREAALEGAEGTAIKNRPLLVRSLAIAIATIAGFLVHGALGLEPATIALLGAAALMLVARLDPHDVLREVEWSTLFFFVGLFILVEAIVSVGIVGGFADAVASATEGDQGAATIPSSGSPPCIRVHRQHPVHRDRDPGRRAPRRGRHGAQRALVVARARRLPRRQPDDHRRSANVLVANLASRDGHPIGFAEFLRYGAAVAVVSLVISTAYVWLRYLG